MVFGSKPSLNFCFFVFNLAFIKLPLTLSANLNTSPDEVVVYATDPRMQYNPPLDSVSGAWSPLYVPSLDRNASQTLESNASVSLVFQGDSLKLYVTSTADFPPLSVNIDNSSTFVEAFDDGADILTIFLFPSGLDPSVNHTVVVQKTAISGRSDSPWNIVAFGITVPFFIQFASASSRAVEPTVHVSASPTAVVNVNVKASIGGAIGGIAALIALSSDLVPVPFTVTMVQSRAGVLSSLGRPWFTFRRRFSLGSSSIATMNSTENDSVGQMSIRRRSNELVTRGIGPRPVSRPPTYITRDALSQTSNTGPPSYVSQNDPFIDQAHQIPEPSSSAIERLSRNMTLGSINPPPSYRSTE
ncbi:hypothetical protein ACEPAH_7876 [Sanghuangporus vaninii]